MAKTPSDARARRLIALLGQLQSDTRLSLSALAEQLGATPAELATDIETLSFCGVAPYDPYALVPIFVDGDTVEVFGEVPALRGPVRLSAREAGALAAALQAAGLASDDPLTSRLLGSASASFDAAELEHVVRAAGTVHDRGVYEQLARRVQEREVVQLEYVSAAQDRPSCREVEPLALFAERGAWYLTAWCRSAGAWRTFRVDRVRSVTPTGEHFDVEQGQKDSAPLRAFEPGGLPRARVSFAPGAGFSAREWPGAEVEAQEGDGTLIVSVPYAGTAWIARMIVAQLGQAEVIEPAEVRSAVGDLAAGLLEE
ncbi:MAG TPA: WYL domain-containing protein [Coriobacteriia bacterium]|nr:WYL domain-containing protein [Coriobacteriia bacterium]